MNNCDGEFTVPVMKTTVPGPKSKVSLLRLCLLASYNTLDLDLFCAQELHQELRQLRVS